MRLGRIEVRDLRMYRKILKVNISKLHSRFSEIRLFEAISVLGTEFSSCVCVCVCVCARVCACVCVRVRACACACVRDS